MKVLICHNRYRSNSPSGENQVVDSEIALLRCAGVEVVQMIEDSDSIVSGGLVAMGNAALGPVYSPKGVRRFKALLREERPDIVHLHNVFPLVSPAVVRVAKSAGVPVVQTIHNYRHTCVNGLHFRDGHLCDDCIGHRVAYPAVLRGCYRGSRPQSVAMALGQAAHRGTWGMVDKLVALTPLMARRLLAAGFEGKQIAVRPSWTADPGEQPAGPGADFLYLGRLEEAKGINLLLEAWRLRKAGSGRRLRIAGTGPLGEHIRSMALLEDNVDYLGHLDRSEVAAAIQDCGVVVIPSLWYEGLPLTFVEALAHGRPAIVNEGTSTASMVTDGLAWSVPPTADSWRETIDMITQDDIEARGMAARKFYSETCSPPAALKSLLQIYQDLLRRSG
jgi:glycosyltransferase involved in cell wall biosynthesis